MKRLCLAASFLLGSSLAFAQAPEVPKHKCEPKPEYPGRLALERERDRVAFQRDIKKYETCIKAFIEERKAVVAAQQTAVNAAIEEYNATLAEINKHQQEPR